MRCSQAALPARVRQSSRSETYLPLLKRMPRHPNRTPLCQTSDRGQRAKKYHTVLPPAAKDDREVLLQMCQAEASKDLLPRNALSALIAPEDADRDDLLPASKRSKNIKTRGPQSEACSSVPCRLDDELRGIKCGGGG